MSEQIRAALLDDHQSIIDGYLYRLSGSEKVHVVATASYGEQLESLLAAQPVDVLVLDVSVPISAANPNPFPILHEIPELLAKYPSLSVLVISMHAERALVKAVMESGASGYILKDDQEAIRDLPAIIETVAGGGIYVSPQVREEILPPGSATPAAALTARQVQALSLCAAYPEWSTAELARRMGVANSTARNLLSSAYLRLDVRTRAAAVAKARQLGLITPEIRSSR